MHLLLELILCSRKWDGHILESIKKVRKDVAEENSEISDNVQVFQHIKSFETGTKGPKSVPA